MKVTVRYFICCESCEKQFGGPNAGEYNPADWNEGELERYLIAEARDLFWITVSCGNDEKLFCSKRCAKRWIAGADCYASAT